jgi:zinc protease
MKKTLLLAFALLLPLVASCTGSREVLVASPGRIYSEKLSPPVPTDPAAVLPVDPEMTTGKLANGMRYFIRSNGVPADRAEIWLAVNAGSVLEDDDQRGLAHFIEHMAFNGTQHFAKQELVKYLESIGMRFGADINASTGYDETVYTLTVPTDKPQYVDKAFEILDDWAHGITFDPQEVNSERGVVIEEWRLGRGAEARMMDEQFPVLFQGSRYAERQPIGKKEILDTVDAAALKRFYHDWYRPDLMAVIVVGDVDPQEIEAKIEHQFSHLRGPDHERPREVFPVPGHKDTLVAIATDPEATASSVGIYAKRDVRPEDHVGDYRRSIVEGLYHRMLNARLDELARRPDPPFLFGVSTSGGFVRSAEVTYQAVGVPDGGIDRGLTALLTEVERVHRHGFTATELERARKEWLLTYEKAAKERRVMQSSTYASEFVRAFLQGEPVPGIRAELELTRRFLPTITLDEVNALAADWLADSNRVILVNAPAKKGVPPPTRESILAVFQKVEESDIPPYEDRVAAGPLVPTTPAPGTIAEESRVPEIGVTTWTLSNGVKVVLKPTTGQRDEILLSAFGPGGHSLASDRDYPSALFAAPLLREGGLGTYDRTSLDKALAGTEVSVLPYIHQLEQGVEGTAASKDAERLFQLVYLTFTAPRKDGDAFRSVRSHLRAAVQNRLAQPEQAFEDKMTEALTQNNPRFRPVTPEWVDRVDLDTAFSFYQQRFADASDFTFLLVGNFNPQTIKPLVLTWLGSLPSTNSHETWRDLGIKPPDGIVKVEVDRGLEPKSEVRIIFSGDAEFSRQSRHDLGALAGALETRLREVLREDMGATYGVSVDADLDRRPRPAYRFTIDFGCAPEKVDPLIQATFAEIAAIQKSGVPETYVKQLKEQERRERELDLTDNNYWLNALEVYLTEGLDLKDLPHYDQLIARVSSNNLRDTARRYLDTKRYILGVLRPAEQPTDAAGGPAAAQQTPKR